MRFGLINLLFSETFARKKNIYIYIKYLKCIIILAIMSTIVMIINIYIFFLLFVKKPILNIFLIY